jgi:hypothetical protein
VVRLVRDRRDAFATDEYNVMLVANKFQTDFDQPLLAVVPTLRVPVRPQAESDGAPDEKESRPKHKPPGYQACMMRGEMWPRRQEGISPPDASPPRCAQLMGLASRGCLVLVLGATAERRKLLFRSDLGLPWIRTLGLPRLSR